MFWKSSPTISTNKKGEISIKNPDINYIIASMLPPLLIWIALYAQRPVHFGFYHDDWITIRELNFSQFIDIMKQFPSRPLLAVLQYSFALAIGADPVIWQFTMALLVLISSIVIGFLAQRISLIIIDDNHLGIASGSLAASLWLSFPWSLGYTAFPTTFNGMISIIIMCILINEIILIQKNSENQQKIVILFVMLLSIFEIFWFFPILIMTLVLMMKPSFSRFRDLVRSRLLWVMLFIQIVYIIYNRALFYFGSGQNKSVGSSAFYVFNISIDIVKNELSNIIPKYYTVLLSISALFIIFIISILTQKSIIKPILGLFVIAFGILYSIFVYAAGGYTLQFSGLGSRSMFGVSFWLAFLPALLVPMGARIGRAVGYLCIALVLVVVTVFSTSLMQNMKPWQRTWAFEQDLLNRFPIGEIVPHLDSRTLILVDAERPDGNIEGFEAFWDIAGALYGRFPALKGIYPSPVTSGPPLRVVATMANFSKFRSAWDGQALSQSWCAQQTPVWTIAASARIVIWRYQTGKLEIRDAPFSLGCGSST